MLAPLNKVNSKHVLEDWECRVTAQVLGPGGPLVGAAGSSLSKLNNLGVNLWWA